MEYFCSAALLLILFLFFLNASLKSRARQQDAGSVHIAVIGAARWDDVKAVLQPKFEMNAETALAKAIPTTLAQYQELLDSIKAAFKLAPPASKTANNVTTPTDAAKKAGQTGPPQAETSPDDPAKTTESSSPAAERAYNKPPFSVPPASYDPIMVYQNAKTIYQLVALLNRSITDAAIKRAYNPYVVTLQISLMPFASGLPYDAYSAISFFSGAESPRDSSIGLNLTGPLPVMEKARDGRETETDEELIERFADEARKRLSFDGSRIIRELRKDPWFKKSHKHAAAEAKELAGKIHRKLLQDHPERSECADDNPFIIPLLSTDNLESGSDVRAANEIRDLSLALVALSKGFKASAGAEGTKQSISSVAGNALNSLLTVGRLSDNTLQVRLGAMMQPGGEKRGNRVMVSRTHNISILLLVPKATAESNAASEKPNSIRASSCTQFRNTQTGRPLGARSASIIERKVKGVLGKYGIQVRKSACGGINPAIKSMRRNSYSGFLFEIKKFTMLCSINSNPEGYDPPYDSLWLDLANIWTGGQYGYFSFDLPPAGMPEPPDTSQTVILEDDLTAKSTAVLKGGRNLSAENILSAALAIDPKNDAAKKILLADSIDVRNGSAVALSFPSLKSFGSNENKPPICEIKLEVKKEKDVRFLQFPSVHYVVLPPPVKPNSAAASGQDSPQPAEKNASAPCPQSPGHEP